MVGRRIGGVGAAVALLVAACSVPEFVVGPFEPIAEPFPSEIDAVVFLVGDAGDTPRNNSPLLHRLRTDIERWSALVPRDSSVVVLYLGDNVYPVGIRDRDHPSFEADSARLEGLLWAATGPSATRRRTIAHLIPGNHDWGNRAGPQGVERLRNMQRLVDEMLDTTRSVRLTPEPGHPGPVALDVGASVRFLALDTHWWLQAESQAAKQQVLDSIGRTIETAGERRVLLAAHHPYDTGGPHGGGFLDFFFLLRKTGAVVQDLNAEVFEDLKRGLTETFEQSGRPFGWVAGHDHSLQVMRTVGLGAPTWTLVSGAGSKLTPVGETPGLEWAGNRPGYMRLMFTRNGEVELFVDAAPARFLDCEGPEPAQCVAEGAAAFQTVYSRLLN